MRQLALQMCVTLDGYLAGPDGELDWGLQPQHPEVRAWKLAFAGHAGTHTRTQSSRSTTNPRSQEVEPALSYRLLIVPFADQESAHSNNANCRGGADQSLRHELATNEQS